MTVNSNSRGSGASLGDINRRLERAYQHVCDLWLPPDESLLTKIQQGLEEGIYDLDTDFLISELKSDVSLFTYCIRRLVELLDEEGVIVPDHTTPIELMRHAGLRRLKKVLEVRPEEISEHSIRNIDPEQGACLRSALISATTAETIGEKTTLDPDLCYSTGIMRQLGITLIAFNYPHVYQRVLTASKGTDDFDQALARVLGFSPTMLGVVIAKRWGLAPEIRVALGDAQALKEVPENRAVEVKRVGTDLSKLCEIGEALARANEPERFPSAQADWSKAAKQLEDYLGPEGLRVIQERIRQHCAHYVESHPHLFSALERVQPEVALRDQARGNFLDRNPYLKTCPPDLRKRFERLYQNIHPGEVSRDGLNMLLREVVPAAGFVAGCVYLVDPSSMSLIPRVKLGRLAPTRSLSVDYSLAFSGDDPVGSAFRTGATRIDRGQFQGGREVSIFASAFGDSDKAGVLYLEAPEAPIGSDIDLTGRFKAIRSALMACLNLR